MHATAAPAVPADADAVVVALPREADAPKRPLVAREGDRWQVAVAVPADAEAARRGAAEGLKAAESLGAAHVAVDLGPEHAAAAAEGAGLWTWRYKPREDGPRVTVVGAGADEGLVLAEAANWARTLVDSPPNVATPSALGRAARDLHPQVEVEVLGRRRIEALRMGLFAAVAAASQDEPALITARYEPEGATGPVLGLVGKGVTFDSGGLSIKAAATMPGMKRDMAGGAAVLGALRAIATLGLPIRVVAVVGATDNVIGRGAMRPGDVFRARTGTTVEVVNTDAEGRLVLADCLAHAIEAGAERLVDVATLTGGVITALGRHRAGVLSTDDAWRAQLEAAGEAAGEPLWPLPMDEAYDHLIESKVADVVHAELSRQAHATVAGRFLRRFTGDVPWAHVDMAGMPADLERPYLPAKGASGWGVRLLVELARRCAAS